jgi:hypothetical protein
MFSQIENNLSTSQFTFGTGKWFWRMPTYMSMPMLGNTKIGGRAREFALQSKVIKKIMRWGGRKLPYPQTIVQACKRNVRKFVIFLKKLNCMFSAGGAKMLMFLV